MKIYTKEQVNLAMRLIVNDRETFKQVLELLTPIELPSDEEIKSSSFGFSNAIFDKDECFVIGAKWLKEQILNQNK